jgi:NADP-dependent 3-hydroxy acid dehydrogenase YdfG
MTLLAVSWDIGNAATEMTDRITAGVMQADGTKKIEPRMDLQHVANAVVFIANLPLDANVRWMTLMATKMPRGPTTGARCSIIGGP